MSLKPDDDPSFHINWGDEARRIESRSLGGAAIGGADGFIAGAIEGAAETGVDIARLARNSAFDRIVADRALYDARNQINRRAVRRRLIQPTITQMFRDQPRFGAFGAVGGADVLTPRMPFRRARRSRSRRVRFNKFPSRRRVANRFRARRRVRSRSRSRSRKRRRY